MTPEELQKFRDDFDTLKRKVDGLIKPDRYLFQRDIELFPGYKIRNYIFGGSIDSSGSAIGSLPSGWSVSKVAGTGEYIVTHNLNTANYAAVAIPSSTSANQGGIISFSDTAFTVAFYANGTLENTSFFFILIRT